MLETQKKYKYKNYSYAYVAMHAADTTLNGKNISEINILKGRKSKPKEEAETILDMMIAGGAQMVYHSMNEEDVRYFIKYPFNMIGADGGVSNGKECRIHVPMVPMQECWVNMYGKKDLFLWKKPSEE